MVGVEDHCAFLDRIARVCAVRADHAETEIIPTTETLSHGEEPLLESETMTFNILLTLKDPSVSLCLRGEWF